MFFKIAVYLWCASTCWCVDDDGFLILAEQAISELVIEDSLLQRVPGLMADVDKCLQPIWPDCRLKAYGSLITGLGMHGSDIDMTVLIPDYHTTPNSEKKLLKLARRALKAQSSIFRSFEIPDANVNVLKCIHIPSGIPIDLTFGRLISIQNTLMGRYFLHVDKRAFQMGILLKRWGKVHGFKEHQLFTNYNIVLLIIFYLQQERVLPPVSLLQKNAKPYYIDGWNAAFEEVRYQTNNTKSLYQLLGGFFEFYSEFEFEKYVISVFAGYPVEKSAFTDLEKLPEEFTLYKQNVLNGAAPLDLTGNFTMLECFDFNLKAGSLFKLQLVKDGAEAYRVYSSTAFLEYLLSDNITSIVK